jgi:hypothetical protein
VNKSKKKEKGIATEAELKAAARRARLKTIGVFDSKSNPGTEHKVTHMPASGEIECSCKGFMYNGSCSHIQRVLADNTGGIRMTLERERADITSKERSYAKAYGGGRR